jgi:hypothetical protein
VLFLAEKQTTMINIGTISHGTLRAQDLLRSFAEAYEQYCKGEEWFQSDLKKVANRFADYLDKHDGHHREIPEKVIGQIHDVLNSLIDDLDYIAAEHGLYFGHTEGDASDFGFWIADEIDYPDDDDGYAGYIN